MLSPADEALAARDPLLPDLGLVLDADACATLIADRIGGPVHLTPRYLRYKPGTSCVLAADVTSPAGDQSLLITSYAAESPEKVTKAVRRAPEGSVLIAEPDRGLLMATAAADRDLPGLSALHDHRWPRLLRRLLGQHDLDVDDLQLRTIRHNPQRRWVGTINVAHNPQALLRVYRPEHMCRSTDAIAAVASTDLAAPGLLGIHTRLGVAATQFIPGVTLAELNITADPRQESAGYEAAGRVLARLHACTGLALAPIGTMAETSSIRKSIRQLIRLLPGIAAELNALSDSVAERLSVLPTLRRPIHGDFSADQVVIGDDGRATVIDLDSARLGDPASDLGCAAAALCRDVALGSVPPDSYDRRLQALFEGYVSGGGEVDLDRVATHEAAFLLRRAAEPFRLRRTPDWPEAARQLVERAGDVLLAAPGGGRIASAGLGGDSQGWRSDESRRRTLHRRPAMNDALREVCAVAAAEDLRLYKAIPREPGHLLLDLRRPDGSIVAGQWFADRTRAGHVARSTRESCDNQGVHLIQSSGVVLQSGGADRRLRTLPTLVATGGSTLVAHRPERRAVVRQTGPDGRVQFAKAVRRDRLGDLLRAGRSRDIPGVALPRVIAVDRSGSTVSTEALPGRLLHDLLGDSQVPQASLVAAARAVGAAVAALHSAVPPVNVGHHDSAAELSTTLRWWERAAAYDLLDLEGSLAREGFAAARRLLAGQPGPATYLHRDLHDRQLLVSTGGQVGMLDFDLASVGEPALDLANLLVHLELRAVQERCSTARAKLCSRAILEGYDPNPLMALRIPGYSLTTRLRLAAVYAFRPGSSRAARDLLTMGLDALKPMERQRG